jgi:hypothetical protein
VGLLLFQEEKYQERRPVTRDKINKNKNTTTTEAAAGGAQ